MAQKTAISSTVSPLTYADVADLALTSQIAAHVKIKSATQLGGATIIGLRPTQKRFLVEADVLNLIRGVGGFAPRIKYIVDLESDARGKFLKLSKAEMILFALPVANRPAEIRLVAPDAQQSATPALIAQVRTILGEALSPDAPPAVTSVGSAFYAPGTQTGESETQIFLNTSDGRPLSLSIWRQPGQPSKWAVSLGEIIDQAAAQPARNSLLWYRLACFLPPIIPATSTESLSYSDIRIVGQDYAKVVTDLGRCPRNRPIRP